MERILCLVTTEDDGTLCRAALATLRAGLDLARDLPAATLTVGLVGSQVQAAADSIASCGATAMLAVAGADFGVSRYGSDVAAIEAIARAAEATLLLAPATSRLSRVLPGVAQRLGGRIDTKLTGAAVQRGQLLVERWYYRQRMLATLTRTERPWLLLLDPAIREPWQGPAGSATVSLLAVDLPEAAQRTRVLGTEQATTGTETIRPDANLLLVVGAGWSKKQADGNTHLEQAERLILDCLAKTQASLGSSKSLVDQADEGAQVLPFLSHLNQVGQTGSTPRHPKGLATCCHGEEPHVVGWRFITERRAINTDASCGWAQGKTDVLYVADAFALVARINALLSER